MGTIYKRGSIWWVKYYRSGKPFFETSGSKKKTDALRLLKDREGDIVKGVPVTPMVNRVTLGELYEDMVNDYEINSRKSLQHMKLRFENHILPYFGEQGGLTVSGGEPTVQAKEIQKLFKAVRKEGFHITLDTCGAIYSEDVNKVYDLVDLVLLDVKHIDPEWHRKLTGNGNGNVLKNAQYREESGKPMWLRYVLVPGWTDQPEFLELFFPTLY